jgi:uncharacterized RDD family membrane protein YckC
MSAARQSALVIETPEGVVFSRVLATPVARALAWAVDASAIGVASTIASRLAAVAGVVSQDWAAALSVLLYFAISIGYGIALEWHWRGQTLGKRLLGLRVVDAQGLRLRLSQIALRNIMRVFDVLPLLYMVGGTACLLSRSCQRLGDLAANTAVVRERGWEGMDTEEIAPAKYNSLLAHPHLAARLRDLASPEAAAIALRAVCQRNRYDAPARVALFAELADYFRSLVAFPAETVEALSDEEYVRAVLRAVFG